MPLFHLSFLELLLVLLGDQHTFLIVLKDVVEAAQLVGVLAHVVTSDQAKRLALLLLELKHHLGPLLVVIHKYLEVNQIIGLNDAILEFDEDFLLVLLKLWELRQVFWQYARAFQDLALLYMIRQLPQMVLVVP